MEARPSGTYFCVLREGEKISGRGLVGLRGEEGSAGRMKEGRWCAGAGVVVGVWWSVSGLACVVVNGTGVRGGGTRKRCVVGGL